MTLNEIEQTITEELGKVLEEIKGLHALSDRIGCLGEILPMVLALRPVQSDPMNYQAHELSRDCPCGPRVEEVSAS